MQMIARIVKPLSGGMLSNAALLCLLTVASGALPVFAENPPTFLFEGLLDTYFDDRSGLIAFDDYDLAFAPDEPLDARITVLHSDGSEAASFRFHPAYRNRAGVIARASLENPADVTLTEPGNYLIEFSVNGQPGNQFPVSLERIGSGDAFNPDAALRFHGPWSRYAHIKMDQWQGSDWPVLSFWAGQRDFAETAFQEPFMVEMKRNGELVAHSKLTQGSIPNKHYQRIEAHLYHPHDRQASPNAKPFMKADWTRSGEYEITISRQSDNEIIRSFDYTASNGEIEPISEARPGYQPHTGYLAPRAIKKGSPGYEFTAVIWLKN